MTFTAALYDGKLGYTAQQDRNFISSLLQPGVVGPGDCKVVAGSGMTCTIPAGTVVMPNTFMSVRGGNYISMNDGNLATEHPPADGSNPRMDQIFIKVYDSETGGDASDSVRPVVVAGNPITGATLDNRSGVGAIPSNSVRLADVLIPAGSTSISNSNIRDRRPWSRGAYKLIRTFRPITLGTSMAVLSSTSLSTRLELSGCPVTASFRCVFEGPTSEAVAQVEVEPGTDFNVEQYSYLQHMGAFFIASEHEAVSYQWDNHAPVAGSKLIQPRGRYISVACRILGREAAPIIPIEFIVIEHPRQNAENG